MSIPFIGSDGCSGHHFEERRKTGNYRISSSSKYVHTAEKEVEVRCQHEGCHETKTRWRRISDRVETRNAARDYGHDVDEKIRTDTFAYERVAREVLAEHITSRPEGSA